MGLKVFVAFNLTVVLFYLATISSASRSEELLFLDILSGKDVKPPVVAAAFSITDGNNETESLTVDPIQMAENEINNFISKNDIFQGMKQKHAQAVQACVEALISNSTGLTDSLEIMYRAAKLRGQINSHVWINCLLSTTVSSPPMVRMRKPALLQVAPDRFVPGQFFDSGIISPTESKPKNDDVEAEVVNHVVDQQATPDSNCNLLDETVGEVNGVENRLWYFREDIMVNAQHWYWHLEYPMADSQKLDRQGELFYYFHQSMLSRYNSERLSNKLPLTLPVRLESNIIEEGYTTYLRDSNSQGNYGSRGPYQSINFGQLLPYVRYLQTSIDSKALNDQNGQYNDLSTWDGVDKLGEAIVGNTKYANYGYIHGVGHHLISGIANNGGTGVMLDFSTSMRDVVFYRWHALINDIFDRHKALLPQYSPVGGDFPLVWSGVQVASIEITSEGSPRNNMKTFWSERKFDISRGLDIRMVSRPGVPICAKHLDHEPFQYKINMRSEKVGRATIRIFMAPRFNFDGRRFSMEEQRKLFFVLDTFSMNLNYGDNEIGRSSLSSTLTKPWSRTFEELEQGRSESMPECGCGWPEHMLIPKGTTEGMAFDLFVIATDGTEDFYGDLGQQSGSCSQPYHYCGIRGQRYPDRKPMGFPFDRRAPLSQRRGRSVENLDELIELIPNSNTVQVVITHMDQVMPMFR